MNPTTSLRRTTRTQLEDALMLVYRTEEETKELTKTNEKRDEKVSVIIYVFEIYSNTVGNGNDSGRIFTHVYEFRCHPKDSTIFKSFLACCSKDHDISFNFISFHFI